MEWNQGVEEGAVEAEWQQEARGQQWVAQSLKFNL